MKWMKIGGHLCEVVRVVSGSVFLDSRVILTPKRLKGQRVADDKLWAEVEEQCASLPDDVRRDIARSDRRQYDRRRATRPRGANSHKGVNSKSGRKINARPRTGGHFVAIDGEGVNLSRKTSNVATGISTRVAWRI